MRLDDVLVRDDPLASPQPGGGDPAVRTADLEPGQTAGQEREVVHHRGRTVADDVARCDPSGAGEPPHMVEAIALPPGERARVRSCAIRRGTSAPGEEQRGILEEVPEPRMGGVRAVRGDGIDAAGDPDEAAGEGRLEDGGLDPDGPGLSSGEDVVHSPSLEWTARVCERACEPVDGRSSSPVDVTSRCIRL